MCGAQASKPTQGTKAGLLMSKKPSLLGETTEQALYFCLDLFACRASWLKLEPISAKNLPEIKRLLQICQLVKCLFIACC